MERTIKKGEFVVVTTGQCSEYSLHYLAKATTTFDAEKVRAEFLSDKPVEVKDGFDDYAFIAYLRLRGYLEPVACIELCIHGYGEGLITLGELNG